MDEREITLKKYVSIESTLENCILLFEKGICIATHNVHCAPVELRSSVFYDF